MRLHLHGVVRTSHPSPPGAPFRLVRAHDLAAIVSDAPSGRATTDQDALAHLEMLSRVVLDGPVVPFRLGTVAEDEDSARTDVLAQQAGLLREHLDRLDGVAEVHVYLRFSESAALRAVHEEGGWRRVAGVDLAARIRIGEQIGQRLAAWRRAKSDALLTAVSALATGEVFLGEREHLEERRAFLVALDRLEDVRKAVADLGADVSTEYVGPLPAYSFLDGEVSAEKAPASRWGW
ncbi:MAG TPA: GvpL/GvpF family gas vesicle protein [Amycolatopsis sp.]|uniref:GvpL/GvpF family gas vesicle protein n=1 Tax=Amycolatopsis sp. TaxID=37632 RepID=UPI002B4895FA|nr:GvpL/GvpF family gas vesicle protein [Amycolatopsis sp.]HKS46895.1 GvpL/GvpF family gas vesicle protein [Amycolatopsis sp.]